MKEKNTYGNHKVYSPDGILMFRCSMKRINWYLNRDLAEVIDIVDDAYSIKFKFKPKGLGNDGDLFQLSTKDAGCVVCGETKVENLTKHHIVPYMFKKYFPDELKNYNSYDVAMMCLIHHDEYEKKANELKNQIFYEFGLPTFETQTEYLKLRKLAGALLVYKESIPKSRIKEIKGIIEERTKEKASKENLIKLASQDFDMGKMVVEKITNFEEFVIRWRKHFIENAKPKFMSEHWDIYRNVY